MKAKAILAIAAVAATMTACSPSQTKVEEVAPENNPDMGVIDKGDSLVVTDVAPSDSAQIAADTAAVAPLTAPGPFPQRNTRKGVSKPPKKQH